MGDDEFFSIMQSLNIKQRNYCMDILYRVKTSTEQTLGFVFGKVRTGKSNLLRAIYQSLLRYYKSQSVARAESIKVLLCAPNEIIAINIGGITLQSAFSLPVNQDRLEFTKLSADMRVSLHCKLKDLKVIIIDELSMVTGTMFEQLDHRLREIFNSIDKFGGKSVFCFGDLYQCIPGDDIFVFQCELWKSFKGYELTEIVCPEEDLPFVTALHNLAVGECTEEDIALFKSREIQNL